MPELIDQDDEDSDDEDDEDSEEEDLDEEEGVGADGLKRKDSDDDHETGIGLRRGSRIQEGLRKPGCYAMVTKKLSEDTQDQVLKES
jgi:hypothetical protein